MSTQISKVTLTNFQKVSYAEIVPTGNLIVLAGKNGAGKTSTTDGIEATLCGHDSKVIRRPIHDGAHKGSVLIEFSDGSTALRSYTPTGGSTLKFTGADGAKYGQKDLNARISSMGIDGRSFMDMDDKSRLKELLAVVDLPFVPAELDAQRKAIFDERTGVNRDIKQLEAQHAAFLPMPADLPDEEVSVSTLITQHHTAVQQNQAVEQAHAAVKSWTDEVSRLTTLLAEAEDNLEQATAHAASAPALIDTDAIQAQIDTAEVTNSQVRVSKEKRAVGARLLAAVQTAGDLTAQLADIDQTKADGLANAQMPIDGLSFDEEGVLYQGIPYARAAGAEKGIVSIAMIIASNPDLRVIVFRDGNIFDMESLKIVQEMAEDNDFKVFIEVVADEKGDEEFYFEDGELA